ncbi:outer membrane protein transport protein, partial [bacterium]|nr:outer membrane protein transport protein [bacterium]
MMKIRSPLFIISLFLLTSLSAYADYYGTYGLFPQGSAKVSAMGGAYTGYSKDINGVLYNPAGIALADWGIDFGGNANQIINLEADLNNDGIKDGLPFIYYSYSAAFRLGGLILGAGISEPYHVDMDLSGTDGSGYSENRKLSIALVSFNVPVAFRLTENLAIGVTFQTQSLYERYQHTSDNPATTKIDIGANSEETTNAIYGIAWQQSKNVSWGLCYKKGNKFVVDDSLNTQTGGVNWFKSAVFPGVYTLGIAWQPSEYWLITLDADYIEATKDAVYVGSELVAGFNRIEIDPKKKSIFHSGMQWQFAANSWVDAYLRAGTYNEPPRLIDAAERQHTTFGFAARFAVLTAALSIDGA